MIAIESGSIDVKSERPARFRYRLRFKKVGDLRFISHNDLLRVWERMFRRTGFELRFTEGFHAKPRISSPLSLALGHQGVDEVLDVEFTDLHDAEEIAGRLREEAPAGLEIASVERAPDPVGSFAAEWIEYTCQLPAGVAVNQENLCRREEFLAQSSWVIERHSPGKPVKCIDIRPMVQTIAMEGSEIRLRICMAAGATVRPEEVLAVLGLAERGRAGDLAITRSAVVLRGQSSGQ